MEKEHILLERGIPLPPQEVNSVTASLPLDLEKLYADFDTLYQFDDNDYAISIIAGMLSAITDITLIGIPFKTNAGLLAGPLANYIREQFYQKLPHDEMEKLANSAIAKVSYDAQDNRHTTVWIEGLSAYFHRLLSLGHDPVLAFIVGVLDTFSGTMTTIDKNGAIVIQLMENYADRRAQNLFIATRKSVSASKERCHHINGIARAVYGTIQSTAIWRDRRVQANNRGNCSGNVLPRL